MCVVHEPNLRSSSSSTAGPRHGQFRECACPVGWVRERWHVATGQRTGTYNVKRSPVGTENKEGEE
jgi:hypothetical protein